MFNFMRYRWIYFIVSALVLVPGMFYLIRFGLKPSIDFTGGALIEVKVAKPNTTISTDEVKQLVTQQEVDVGSIQTSGQNTFLLKLKPIDKTKNEQIIKKLQETYPSVEELRFETVGPVLGQELLRKTLVAAVIAMVLILAYVAWAFKNIRFGVSAILALLHDLLVVIGVFAIVGKIWGVEVDVLFVTALLTTMSFSVHDTIVVFDRIRELQKKGGGLTFTEQVDQALTATMGRSLNNSLTILFMLLALFLLGGETVRWFVFALLIGTISGAYSSPFVATPILYVWHQLRDRES
jgi:preprotein translocase subunit SecF